MAVGIEETVLDELKLRANTNSVNDYLRKMLDYWLRNTTPEPRWTDVATALKKINLAQLALHIEKINGKGMYLPHVLS